MTVKNIFESPETRSANEVNSQSYSSKPSNASDSSFLTKPGRNVRVLGEPVQKRL